MEPSSRLYSSPGSRMEMDVGVALDRYAQVLPAVIVPELGGLGHLCQDQKRVGGSRIAVKPGLHIQIAPNFPPSALTASAVSRLGHRAPDAPPFSFRPRRPCIKGLTALIRLAAWVVNRSSKLLITYLLILLDFLGRLLMLDGFRLLPLEWILPVLPALPPLRLLPFRLNFPQLPYGRRGVLRRV